jgi:protein-tyrosine phosphatase
MLRRLFNKHLPEAAALPPSCSILFVCMGNLCRSPMAHSMALDLALEGLRFDSAGTHVGMGGEPMDTRAAEVLRRRGITPRPSARSRPVTASDFERFDLILAMDGENLAHLREAGPIDRRGRIRLLLDLVPGRQGEDVPDPYFGNVAGFEHVYDLCQSGLAALEALHRSGQLTPHRVGQ